jgi:hypothetical protein
LLNLWRLFGERVHSALLVPNLSEEVISFRVEVLSDVELKYRDYMSTESLDLESLSGP